MIKFRPLIKSREGRREIAKALRSVRHRMHLLGQRWSLRSQLLQAKGDVHFDHVHYDVAYRIGQGERYACKARWSWMAEDALARGYAQLVPGTIPLPPGFTFILDQD